MIRRAFVRAISGAVFACALGVKVETWKLEEAEFGVGGDSEASGITPGITVEWSDVRWSLARDGKEWATGVGIETDGEGFILRSPTYWL